MPAQIYIVVSSNIGLTSRVPRLSKLGETMTGHSFHLGYGGKGANQAVMAAKLGARVTMVTKLERDVFGEGTLKNYHEQGVDTTFIMFDESAHLATRKPHPRQVVQRKCWFANSKFPSIQPWKHFGLRSLQWCERF